MKRSMIATRNGQRAPDEDKLVEIYQHHVTFTEVLSESMPQVALHCIVLSEFGLDKSNPWSVFSQLSSLVTSLVCLCIAFGKVSHFIAKPCRIICTMHIFHGLYSNKHS